MRYVFALALLALPGTAFAQMFEGPTGNIPVTKCESFTAGTRCITVDGAGLTSNRGFVRADRGGWPAAAAPAHTLAGG
jgi:hypothetical protein